MGVFQDTDISLYMFVNVSKEEKRDETVCGIRKKMSIRHRKINKVERGKLMIWFVLKCTHYGLFMYPVLLCLVNL